MPAVEAIGRPVHSPYLPEPAHVMRVTRMTELETMYRIELDEGRALNHVPGQFVQISLFGIGECPISICSSPTRSDGFELTVRRVGEVTTAIHRLKVGDFIGIRGPLGRGFDMEWFRGRDVLLVAGGCALAPARSVIQYILDRRKDFGDFHLLYGTRSPAELLYRDELDAWQSRGDVNCRVSVDRADETWTGAVGVVTTLFDRLPVLNPVNTRAIIIGPPAMFRFVTYQVLGRGISQDHIYCSLERRMKCGIGKCGHCQFSHLYACLDGPVFRYSELAAIREAIE